MIVTLNSYTINQPGSNVYLDEEIDGLELPPIRTPSGDNAGTDGGYIGPQFFSLRPITLQGNVFSTSLSALEQTRRDFVNAIKTKTITLQLVTNAGASYIIYAKLVDFKMPIKRDLFQAPFKIDLLAEDPYIYDNASGTALTANLPRMVSGGYTYPVVFPVVYAAGSGPTTVTNAGSEPAYPTITLTGVMTNPVVTNTTTGYFFALTGLTTAPGDVVVIDMRARTVTLNGASIFAKKTTPSTWWLLTPGGNDLTLTTSSGADTVSGVVSWRSSYLGI